MMAITMDNMSAKFDEKANNDLVSCVHRIGNFDFNQLNRKSIGVFLSYFFICV